MPSSADHRCFRISRRVCGKTWRSATSSRCSFTSRATATICIAAACTRFGNVRCPRRKCLARRSRTNTPLQALVLMNDPTFVEASRALASRVMTSAASANDRVVLAFRLAVARTPTANELHTLAALAAQEVTHYRGHPDAATELLGVGESKAGAQLDRAELAAWTTVAQVILNLDETISEE